METTNRKIGSSASWYVIYAAARREKRVEKQLQSAGVECYLPSQAVVRLWNGRKKQVMIPVISGCVFVQLSSVEELGRIIGDNLQGQFLMKSEGEYVTIGDEEMQAFRANVEKADEFIRQGQSMLLSSIGFE